MNRQNLQPVALTEKAAEHVRKFLAHEPDKDVLRIRVKPSGCSGYRYVLELADKLEAHDRVFESHGVKVAVDDKSYAFVAGMELDYVREGLNERLKFHNPNVTSTCGCGESFGVDAAVSGLEPRGEPEPAPTGERA